MELHFEYTALAFFISFKNLLMSLVDPERTLYLAASKAIRSAYLKVSHTEWHKIRISIVERLSKDMGAKRDGEVQ